MAPPLLPQKHTARSLPATPTTDGKCDSQELITVHPAPPTSWKGRGFFFCVVLMLHTISQLPVAWQQCPPRGCSDTMIPWLRGLNRKRTALGVAALTHKCPMVRSAWKKKTSQCCAVRNASSRWTWPWVGGKSGPGKKVGLARSGPAGVPVTWLPAQAPLHPQPHHQAAQHLSARSTEGAPVHGCLSRATIHSSCLPDQASWPRPLRTTEDE